MEKNALKTWLGNNEPFIQTNQYKNQFKHI